MTREGLDLAIVDADVVTLDPDHPRAGAIGIQGGRVACVGDDAEVLASASDGTRVIRAAGAMVVPGLVDGHAHLDREGLRDLYPAMTGLPTVDAVLDRIERLVAVTPPGEWLVTMPLGDPPYYEGEQPFPTLEQLDRVSGSTPVFIRPIWGYWRHRLPLRSMLNSEALRRLGPDALDQVATWSDVEVDPATGRPTGRIDERTFEPTLELLLPGGAGRFDGETRRRGIVRASAHYASTGTTGVYEGHGAAAEVSAAYRAVRETGEPVVRARLPLSLPWADLTPAARADLRRGPVDAVARGGDGDDLVRFQGVSLGTPHDSPGSAVRRAARPYTGWAGFDPGSWLPEDELVDELVACARAGVQVAAMTPDMLGVFSRVDAIAPIGRLRWVIGHVNVLDRADVSTIRRLGLAVTTHTNRYLFKEGALGQERAESSGGRVVPLRSLLDAGIPVSLGTDNVPTSLLGPIRHVVDRTTRDGAVVDAEQAISRLEALRCATVGGAWLSFDETWRGRLAPGWAADLAMLTDDLLAVPGPALPEVRSMLTVVDGRVVHES